jgi:hypothetical protein
MSRYLSLSLVALLMTSCGRPDEVIAHQFAITHEDGVERAVTTGGPKYPTELFTYELILRIEPDETRPETLLDAPSTMLLGDDGHYYVCDNGNHRIAVFDTEGNYVRSFGRRGYGPGEFVWMDLLGLQGDTLTIFDSSQNRVSLMTTGGRLIRSVTLGVRRVGPRKAYLVGPDVILDIFATVEYRGVEDWRDMKCVIERADGDTVGVIEVPPIHVRMLIQAPVMVGYPVYFTAFPNIGYAWDRGLFRYDPREPELRWYTVAGVLRRVFRIDLPRVAPSAEDRRFYEDLWDERITQAQETGDRSAKVVRENLVFGAYVPFWTTVLIDDRGYSWLGLPETSGKMEAAGGTAFRLLSPEGEYLGDTCWPFVLPGSSYLGYTRVGKGRLMVLEPDPETDVMIPTVYRLSSAVAGFRYP